MQVHGAPRGEGCGWPVVHKAFCQDRPEDKQPAHMGLPQAAAREP